MRSNPSSLYVHIPFCNSICTYCDFKKFIYNQKRVDDYFQSLFFELEKYKNRKYTSIYIGGGTPSCIDKSNLERLLKTLSMMLKNSYKEFTIENNVEDINEDYLALLKKYNINRLSIGVQTIVPKYIKLFNRHHTESIAKSNIELACKYIPNVSIDMIYALPNQTKSILNKDLEFIRNLPIKHVSYYSLLIEENTVLYSKGYKDMNDAKQATMYKYIVNTLSCFGYKKYEVSNFAKFKKYQSFHNKTYWKNQYYDAIGLAASGYCGNQRYTNQTNINLYIKGDYTYSESNVLSRKDKLFDEIMLGLRLDEGININKINKKYKIDFLVKYKSIVSKYIHNKCLVIEKGNIHTTLKGCLLLNSILIDFID